MRQLRPYAAADDSVARLAPKLPAGVQDAFKSSEYPVTNDRLSLPLTVRVLAVAVLMAMPMIAEGRPARPAPPLPAPTGRVVPVSSEPGLQAAMRDLTSDTTILIAPGTYVLTRTL